MRHRARVWRVQRELVVRICAQSRVVQGAIRVAWEGMARGVRRVVCSGANVTRSGRGRGAG
eukprot:8492088-Lingulodinium_polyedra.AAC.1